LEVRNKPQERRNYLPEFEGFSQIFGLRTIAAGSLAVVELDPTIDGKVATSKRPHRVLAEALTGVVVTENIIRGETLRGCDW